MKDGETPPLKPSKPLTDFEAYLAALAQVRKIEIPSPFGKEKPPTSLPRSA